jgi:aldehyde dehydrogenase (NAD+)
VLIQQGIYEPLLQRLGGVFSRLQAGLAAMNLDLVPLIRASQLERVTGFLDQAHAAGIALVGQGKSLRACLRVAFTRPPLCCAMCR